MFNHQHHHAVFKVIVIFSVQFKQTNKSTDALTFVYRHEMQAIRFYLTHFSYVSRYIVSFFILCMEMELENIYTCALTVEVLEEEAD